ncbi:hypothetical protein P3T76_016057 [Phytophthora citrophthora]|uniref:Uncharacterized protein n=1 Tax=Phytophthora citrophthora TaxID=4793 RepID=A0AAD9L9Q5_9STRA|nr:hypothetical protein P3T76_016057 [Phytophthora citrophthora]
MADVTLTLRGERIPLRNAVCSVYNRERHELLVATPTALYLYSHLLTAGGDLLATLVAEENAHYQFALHLPWLDVYSIVVVTASGKLEHRIVSTDLKTSLTSHIILEKDGGQFYTALANPHRRELVTADSDGGIKVWALRVLTTAQNNGGFKGVLRLHTAANSTKKPYYRHLQMSFDGQRIFAATSAKVYMFDAASFHRLPCCLHEDRRSIFSMECGKNDNSVYLVFTTNMRKVCKYEFIMKKGSSQFRKVGEYEHDQEIAVCIENSQYSEDSYSTGNGVVVIDTCATFTTANLFNRKSANSDDNINIPCHSAVTLPFNPPSERYNALHTERVPDGRIFAFAVWSTGFCIVELLFANAQGRLSCCSFNGGSLKRYDGLEAGGFISIYQQVPSSQVIMFKEGIPNFRFAPLPTITSSIFNDEVTEFTALPIVDYVIAADAIIVLWPHGLVEKHNLSDNRIFTVAQPFESAGLTATTMIGLFFGGCNCVITGDSMGTVRVSPLLNSDAESHDLITMKQAHTNDRVAVLIDITNNAVPLENSFSLVSVSRGGEVKRWHVKSNNDQSHVWELLACFRTYSPDVSTAAFEFPEFLFCGFDGGSVECWRFPSGRQTSSNRLDPQSATNRILVVKRALHVVDLHMAPVLSFVSESGAGTAVLSSLPVGDNFSWIFSYDQDAIILVWCFSLSFLFPHRRIKVHERIKGIYVSPANGFLDLFAYVDCCIDRVDHLGSGDKEAVRQRLQRGRELSAQRELRIQEDTGKRSTSSQGGRRLRASVYTPDLYDRSRLLAGAPSVRINITLPAVESRLNAVHKTSVVAFPVRTIIEEPKPAPSPVIDTQFEARDEIDTLRSVLSSSPSRFVDRPPSKSKFQPSTSPPRSSPRRRKRSKKKKSDTKSKYLPGKNSLPSSFQQTKPRVYRDTVDPLNSLSSQARCAVITAGDAYASSSSSEDEENSEILDTADVAIDLARSTTNDFRQEKVAVVSLVEDEDEAILLLDYQPGSRRSRTRRVRKQLEKESSDSSEPSFEIPFLPWERMSELDRRVELKAASKSKCIRKEAERDQVFVPPVEDFESLEIEVQLGIRSFMRWFAASNRHRQRIRERFLIEELTFAAIDPVIHEKLADVGLSPPAAYQVGQSSSVQWREFVSWYCLGLTTRHQTIPPEVLQRERIKARTEYLELRLRLVAQSEREVQEEEERAGPCEEECEPPQQVFIFEHFVKRSLSDQDSPTSWENTSLENRQKEIALALMDPAVQIAAMRNDIELPDVSGSCMEDFDILALAGKFVPWWKASRNIHRRDFLKREAHEASTSKAVLELLSKEASETMDSNGVVKGFFESYFTSDTARYTFLKKKLFYLKRKSRIASVARYGKLPAPLVLETLPLPLVSAFGFAQRKVAEEVEIDEITKAVEEEGAREEPETMIEAKQSVIDSIDNQRDQEEQELRRREGEDAQITLELIDMAREDALSREYNNSFVESDEEVEEPSLVIPKRTDFSRSYFFGNLPVHYRKVASSGWRGGSGVDNGDEEYEEEEQLERERERQRLLDEQEAERLLELERQAERARIEREREEKAYQFRRVRQAELKKVLAHQAELEAQRKADLEIARQAIERSQMQHEDEYSRWHRDQLLRDRSGMTLEDQLAFQIRKELREAAIAKMRLLLHEQACMLEEDQRSLLVKKELQELEHERAVRTVFLSELYTPFQPHYRSSVEASEAFLPQIQWRLEQEQLRRTPAKAVGCYTISLEEALTMDELDQEPYLARDSRKFKLLMGLPLRTPSSQKRSRIPTADAIIAMQQQQRKLAEFGDERQETSIDTGKYAPVPHKVRIQSRITNSNDCNRLPDITPRVRSVTSLTDLKEACTQQAAASPSKKKHIKSNQLHQQNQSLPFFRGNMLVQGHSQARSKDYTC